MRSMLAALAVGLAATAAQADGTLVGSCTSYGPEVSCPVDLVRGQDYDIVSEYDDQRDSGTAALVNPAGVTTIGPSESLSQEFRAAYSATYQIKVDSYHEPYSYVAKLFTDCKEAVNTQCTIAVGERKSGYNTAYADRDWYRAELRKGSTYTLTLDGLGTTTYMALLDKNGRFLVEARYNRTPKTLRYQAKYTGTYYFQTSRGRQHAISLR